jgi:nucleoside-diphosphate-sugar epimerase
MKAGMEIVVLRPTMVYGPGVKGNFARMMKVVSMGIPLPLRSINNRRSMISLKNCVDLILCAAQHDKAAGNIYLMGDGNDLSTPELLRRLGEAMKKPVRLFPLPRSIFALGMGLLNQRGVAQRLVENLQVDITRAQRDLNWSPIQSVDDGIAAVMQSNRQLIFS